MFLIVPIYKLHSKTSMKIEHIALYVRDLESSRLFYCNYFGGKSSDKYENPRKHFTSCFVQFEGGCRLELIHQPERLQQNAKENLGIHHFAFTVGSKTKVDELTNQLRKDGNEIFGEPRVTGDGYYESVVLDPDGNLVEITE